MRTTARAAHGVLALITLFALVSQLALSVQGSDASTSVSRLFSFFTVESSILVCAGSAALAIRPDADGPLFRVLRLDGLLGIAATGIVNRLVSTELGHPSGLAQVCTVVFHDIVPPAAVLIWLLVGPRPRITWPVCAAAMVWPVAWVVWTLAHGAAGGWYPYPFIDAARQGYPRVVLNVAVVGVAMSMLAAVLRLLDRVLPAAPADELARSDRQPPVAEAAS